ncbi:MAG: DUF3373 domain-containing protein [Proteobacteria bacterium]|nr:DUF3373 domain-containing protein [Pseudomonadota bacterium]
MKLFRFKNTLRLVPLVCFLIFIMFNMTPVFASEDMAGLQEEINALNTKINALDNRLNKTELHTATDKISLGLELRTRVDSIHYEDMRIAPSWLMNGFFIDAMTNPITGQALTPEDIPMLMTMMPPGSTLQDMIAMSGFNGATKDYIQGMMAFLSSMGMTPEAEKYNADNDFMFTNRLRLEMKSKISGNLSFGGRLSMYKVYGDSSGIKFNTGSFNDIYLDGNTTSVPHGDTVHVERAYFNYKTGTDRVPVNVSFGRRPATEGPPLEYKNYSMEGGSPMAPIINWQFDGASLSFGLEDVTGIPGAAFKLCYGVGFESDWGNSYSLTDGRHIEDATFGGFIATLYDNELTSVELNYAHAWDITDGFTGLMLMPFIPFEEADGTYAFEMNKGGYISRMQATENIGDFDLATILVRSNLSELLADIDVFLSLSMSHTKPDDLSKNPFYGLMGMGLLSSNGDMEEQDGYSIYTGAIFPMPFKARLGVEYNKGSKYWINMTGAEDSLVASKLAARGSVVETYYIQPVVNKNFFLTLGGVFYDYDYTGSGNPLGAPVKISDMKAFDAFFPVADKVWNVYLSATLRY